MKESDLAELRTDISWIKESLSNHLRHHEKYEIALAIGILLMVAERILTKFFG